MRLVLTVGLSLILQTNCVLGASKLVNCMPDASRSEIRNAVEKVAKRPHPRLFSDAAGFAVLKGRVASRS